MAELLRTCSFFVPGIARPKGSTRSFVNPNTNRIVTLSDSGGIVQWQSDVKSVANLNWEADPSEKPVALCLEFVRTRPKSHFGTGRNTAVLKASAPHLPATVPDLDKLVRGVLDALTGVVYIDDKLVCLVVVAKSFGAHPGAEIAVREISDSELFGRMGFVFNLGLVRN